jgi:hypothetical protein
VLPLAYGGGGGADVGGAVTATLLVDAGTMLQLNVGRGWPPGGGTGTGATFGGGGATDVRTPAAERSSWPVRWMYWGLCAVGIVEHLDNGGYPRAIGLARGIGVERLGQPVELDSVLARDPEHLGDDVRREQARDILDQVELVPVSNAVSDVGGQPFDPGAHSARSAAQEPGRDKLAVQRVPRRIHRQHHRVVAKIGRAAVIDHDGRAGGEKRGIPADSLDVLVPGHCPEAGSVWLFVPVDGVVIPQPRVLLGGMALGVGRRRHQVNDTSHGAKIQPYIRRVKCLFEAAEAAHLGASNSRSSCRSGRWSAVGHARGGHRSSCSAWLQVTSSQPRCRPYRRLSEALPVHAGPDQHVCGGDM